MGGKSDGGWALHCADMKNPELQLDLTRGKIVKVGTTTSYDFADIERLDDGFWYYRPKGGEGCIEAWVLRVIADRLDEANREWKEQLDKAFEDEAR